MSLSLAACGTIDTSRFIQLSPPDVPGVTAAHGSFQYEFAGVHAVWTVSSIPGRDTVVVDDLQPIASLRDAKWTLDLLAAAADAPAARGWHGTHAAELEGRFRKFVELLDAAYPGNGGRAFRILVLPADAAFRGSWVRIATTSERLPMTFALRIPQGASGFGDTSSLAGIFPLLAHEFSHSYFYFDRDAYRNNYSDEVVAYATEGCVERALFGKAADFAPTGPKDVLEAAATGPRGLFARFAGRYPNTLIAMVAAGAELRRAAADPGGDAALPRYCRTTPLAGHDYTRPDETEALGTR
jgi:hypothetical protein